MVLTIFIKTSIKLHAPLTQTKLQYFKNRGVLNVYNIGIQRV